MATIAEQLTQLSEAKQDIKTSLTNKGLDLSTTAFTDYADKIDTLKIASGDATAANVLNGKTFSNSSGSSTGTMTDNGAVSKSITPSTSSQSYTIPAGYHNGSGKVTVAAAPTSLIDGTATAADVLTGKTFFVDSYTAKTGTMKNNGAVSESITPSSSAQTYTIPAGYHNGSGKVTVSAIPATAKKVQKDYATYHVFEQGDVNYTSSSRDTGGTHNKGVFLCMHNISNGKLQGSTNNSTWVDIVSGTCNGSNDGDPGTPTILTANNVTYRYIRCVTSGYYNGEWKHTFWGVFEAA